MFEPQDHPNDFKYEGGPPVAPYDAAGWTLAYLMNVKFDRILDDFNGPFAKSPVGELLKATPKPIPSGSGFVLSAMANESFLAVNELLKGGAEVYRNTTDGSFYVPASAKAKTILDKAEHGFGMRITAGKKPAKSVKLTPSRIAIWDTYGGSMPSGWIRFIMEQYHFDATVIYPQDIDKGDLKDKYDVIVFVGGSIPAFNPNAATANRGGFGAPSIENIPEEYKRTIGRVTQETSIPQLKAFMEAGGNVVAIGSATNLAAHLGIPVSNSLVETVGGKETRLPATKYYVPGSVLSVSLDKSLSANWGLDQNTDVYFDNSPVFNVDKAAITSGKVKPLAYFSSATPLRSGWAWGQNYLKDGVAAFEADYGKGKLYAFGPEITFRSQTHGTFKWMFNQLYK